jgi:SAM-dependent methyltransferase
VTAGAKAQRAKEDYELRVGALAHFEDPDYYAQTYAWRTEDVAYYTELARRARGPVLEYGIGAGRIAIPMAHAGARVVGVDHSRPMLADLARRLAEEPAEVRARVEARFGDMRRLRLRRRFPLVVAPFNVLLHLYTRQDVERFLARVREHLAPGGRFVMDLSMPMPEDLARDPLRAHGAPRFRHPSAGVVRYCEHFDYDRARQILFVTMEMTPVATPRESFAVPLAQRQFFPREWEALLHYNGFSIEHLYGDFHHGDFDSQSDVMVIHARRRRR